jgi:hypothetical protein
MILTELLRDGTLIKHYSDKGVLLLQNETGAKYADPVDIYPCPFTYSETDEPIETEEETEMTETEQKAVAYDIITGVRE